MTRPFSWYPLASSDPVPGEPVVVRAGGDHYRRVATAIGDAERVLRALVDTQEAVSDAVDAIRDRTHAVADRIRQAHKRYDAAGDALVGYSIQLDLAQHESLDALHVAQAAQRTVDEADSAIRRLTLQLDDADEGDDVTSLRRALATVRSERADAEVAVTRARLLLEEAVVRRDVAARRAVETLDDGLDDGLDDTWWEDWGAETAQAVSTWAGLVATTTGVLSLFLGWVPFLGQALVLVSVIAGAAALAADIALAVKRGDGSDWCNVALGVVGLLTFGLGRAIAASIDAFTVSARATASQVTRAANRSFASRFSPLPSRAPLPRRSPATSISDAAGGRGGYSQQLREAWAQVRSTRGTDRLLTLAGHGDLVAQNNALRSLLWDAFPLHPRAFVTLLGPTVRGALLELEVAVSYAGDAALALTSATKTTLDMLNQPAPAADRLQL